MWNLPHTGPHFALSPPAALSTSRVQIQPGLTVFTRMLCAERSKAMQRVS